MLKWFTGMGGYRVWVFMGLGNRAIVDGKKLGVEEITDEEGGQNKVAGGGRRVLGE